jgi:hypothetical protein
VPQLRQPSRELLQVDAGEIPRYGVEGENNRADDPEAGALAGEAASRRFQVIERPSAS